MGVESCSLFFFSLCWSIRHATMNNQLFSRNKRSLLLPFGKSEKNIFRQQIHIPVFQSPKYWKVVGAIFLDLLFLYSYAAVFTKYIEIFQGPVHAYVAVPGGKTSYLSELKAGKEVIVVDQKGQQRTAIVGRVKIETRPLILVEAKVGFKFCKEERNWFSDNISNPMTAHFGWCYFTYCRTLVKLLKFTTAYDSINCLKIFTKYIFKMHLDP